MTAETFARVQSSFTVMTPHLEAMTERFYAHLFAARPAVRPLFQVNMDVQRRHLSAALALIVRNLGVLDALDVPIRELGARHARVGVKPEHYPAVLDAMLLAMQDTLGDTWTIELAQDWSVLLLSIAGKMIAGGSANT